jgi:hypothetical protein
MFEHILIGAYIAQELVKGAAMPDILLGPGEDDDETAPPPHFSDPTSIAEVEDEDDEGDE